MTDISRRSFISATAGAALGIAGWNSVEARPTGQASMTIRPAKQVILLFLSGGPSQIDTWDPKPQAPVEVRNFDPDCATTIPGVRISQNLPLMAQRMHQVSLVRSLHHTGPATHAAGQQQLMTGSCFVHDQAVPYFGSVLTSLFDSHPEMPGAVILGGDLQNEYSTEAPAQSAAWLPNEYAPLVVAGNSSSLFRPHLTEALSVDGESWETQSRFGFHDLGRMCLQARRLIERGSRIVTINQFPAVMDRTTWDMHANGGRLNSTAADYRETLCPQLDQALSGLLDDLTERGLLSETVVAVCGEMGRTPVINRYGGRDHHTGCWTGLLAGGAIRPGIVIGGSDEEGATPNERPVTPAEYCSTIYRALGIDAAREMISIPGRRPVPLLVANPIAELL